jgi:hypothetical protein
VRSSARRTILISTFFCPGPRPIRAIAAGGSAARGVSDRTSTASTTSASGPSAARTRSPSVSASSPSASAIDRSRVIGGCADTARYGARSCICAATRGSAARRSRMSGTPLRTITSRSSPSPIASPVAAASPASASTRGCASPHSPISSAPAASATSICRPASVYGCTAGVVVHRRPGSAAATTAAIIASRSLVVSAAAPRRIRHRSSWWGSPTWWRSITSRRYTSPGHTTRTSVHAGSRARSSSAAGISAEVCVLSRTSRLTQRE